MITARVALPPVARLLGELHATHATRTDGQVATYIPVLAAADPSAFGIALASIDGHVYAVGDAAVPFTIQSISKPFVYALAVAELGMARVLERVGLEPSGEPFNAISLESGTGRPANPMINAGAILTTSLLDAATPDARVARVVDGLSAFAGRPLAVDAGVYRSEDGAAQRNRAIAWLLHGAGILTVDVEVAVRTYLQQCSVVVTARDIAVMGATLANGGVQPLTRQQVVPEEVADLVLTVMATCGMYDGSGAWLARVGLPAKSGVAGGLLAVLPGQVGIGLFSPPLDEHGNSVRSAAACADLSRRFGLHLMRVPTRGWPGRGVEDADDARVLHRSLSGDLGFIAAERLLESLPDDRSGSAGLVLDLRAVGTVHPAGVALVRAGIEELAADGVRTVIVDDHGPRWFAGVTHAPTRAAAAALATGAHDDRMPGVGEPAP